MAAPTQDYYQRDTAQFPYGSTTEYPVIRAFLSDPDWTEAWWWLGVPALTAVFLITAYQLFPEFYTAWVLPEGYSFLELGHFFIPLAASILAFRLLFRDYVRQHRLAFIWLLVVGIGCFYIAGEEHSWGQHLFYWETPEAWSEINRQDETNLHNAFGLLNHIPRTFLEIGILIGGLILPLAAMFRSEVHHNRWALYLPANAMVPVALGWLLFKGAATIHKDLDMAPLVERPAESTETFIYMFLLFYVIVCARRVRELEALQAARRS